LGRESGRACPFMGTKTPPVSGNELVVWSEQPHVVG
jgi:hypothetical protein